MLLPIHIAPLMNKNIFRIALTGGPCAGKTTALVKIIERFTDRGFLVYALPETPTLFMNASVNFCTEDKTYFYNIEKSILRFQMQMEDTFMQLARTVSQPVILISDRGTMDISAYMDRDMWLAILDEMGVSEVMIRDARYDAVIHMVTAANGAAEFYTTENNSARHENIELACQVDEKVLHAWTGHHNLRIVDNDKDFERKIGNCLAIIASIVGDQADGALRRKYLVELVGEIPYGNETEIYEYDLKTDVPGGIKIRKRGLQGTFVYFITQRAVSSTTGKSVEVERQISADEFATYRRQALQEKPVIKLRKSFVWKGQSFNVDTFVEPAKDEAILHVVTDNAEETITFPHFIRVLRELPVD